MNIYHKLLRGMILGLMGLSGVSLMVMMGGATLFAHARGRGDEKDAQVWFSASIWYAALLSALITVSFCAFSDPIFRFFGADDELIGPVKAYFAPIRFA